MSLLTFLTDGCDNAWIAADSAETWKSGVQTTRLPAPVCKLKIVRNGGLSVLIGIAGEAEIAGKHIFEHLEPLESDLFSDPGLVRVRDQLAQAWQRDYDTFAWDTEVEKIDYADTANVNVLIIDSPRRFNLIHGKVGALQLRPLSPPHYINLFGLPRDVQGLRNEPEKPAGEWPAFLSTIFANATVNSQAVGFPVDVARWHPARGFTLVRCDTPEAIAALKDP